MPSLHATIRIIPGLTTPPSLLKVWMRKGGIWPDEYGEIVSAVCTAAKDPAV